MHSSRMHTGRALTISGAGGGCGGVGGCASQKNFLGGKEIEKKRKKISDTPPKKILSRPPPQNLGQTPPRKFGSDNPPPKIWVRHPPRKFGSDTPPPVWTDRRL